MKHLFFLIQCCLIDFYEEYGAETMAKEVRLFLGILPSACLFVLGVALAFEKAGG